MGRYAEEAEQDTGSCWVWISIYRVRICRVLLPLRDFKLLRIPACGCSISH